MPKIIITGGAGFIGSKLGEYLNARGHEVVLIDNLSGGYADNLVIEGKPVGKFVKMDIRDKKIVEEMKDADTVFHLAAISALPACQSDPGEAVSVNVAGTANVLEAARKQEVRRVVFASTSAVYENNKKYPCEESDPIDPDLIYSASKMCAERICKSFERAYGMEIAITRYYNVYGPHQDVRRKSPPLVGYIIRELLSGRQPVLHSDGSQKRDYVYIDDVNALNVICMEHRNAVGRTINVASGKAYSVNEIYDMIASIIGTKIKPIYRASERFWDAYPELHQGKYRLNEARLAEEVNKFTLGSTKLSRELLGWSAKTSMEEGLRITVDHARKILKRQGRE